MKGKEKRSLYAFLLLSFSIPLLCVLLMQYCSIFQNGFLHLLLYGIEAASPSIGAVLVYSSKKHGVRDFLREKWINNFSWRFCLLGCLIPAVVIVIGKCISVIILKQDSVFSTISMKKIVIIMWALIAEELGWRGFLQDRLEDNCNKAVWIPIITGCIWALWHYHFILGGTMEIPYAVFLYGCVVESFGYYVITKLARGNIVPASIWHFSGNLFFNLCRINPEWNGGSFVPYYVVNGLYSVYVLAFVVFLHTTKDKYIVRG